MEIEEYMKLLGKGMAEKRAEAALNMLKGSIANGGIITGNTISSTSSINTTTFSTTTTVSPSYYAPTYSLKAIWVRDGTIVLMTTADLNTDMGIIKQDIPKDATLPEKQEGRVLEQFTTVSIRTKYGTLSIKEAENRYKWIITIGDITDEDFIQHKSLIYDPEEWF